MSRAALILLVDDEPSIQKAIEPLLRSRGYDVQVGRTAREAMEAFTRYKPDLVILDLGLPDADGVEVCRWIRGRSEVPILVLSARSAEREKVKALDEGADDFVTKPFGPEELLARVRSALRRIFRPEDPGTGPLGSRRSRARFRPAARHSGRPGDQTYAEGVRPAQRAGQERWTSA